jgi:hypothetical protein
MEAWMNKQTRGSLVFGILLVLGGIYLVLVNVFPGFAEMIHLTFSWPVIIILVGAGLLVLGLLTSQPDLAVPAFIISGIGGILYCQNSSGNWGSWAYSWALIPGFVGLGTLVAYLLGERQRYSIQSALDSISTSLVLFVIFGAIFGAFKDLGPYWPVLLIVAGIITGIKALVKDRHVSTIRG